MRPWLHLVFAVSGAAGLVHQVTWVRQFALVFGNSVHSASVVTATFLGALGLGGWLAGHWADRHRGDLLRAWGWAEVGIGGLGLVVALGMPWWTASAGPWTQYTLTDAGWFELTALSRVVRVAAAVALVGPPALLMGATLTLLIRVVTASPREAGWYIGWLYAANTVGAAVGAMATDVVLVPWLGVFSSQCVAVAANLTVGVGALVVSWGRADAPDPVELDAPGPVAAMPAVAGGLFLAGFAAMGMELVWFRFLAGALGPYRAVFAVLLGVVLLGNALGAGLSGALVRWRGHPARWFALAQALFVVSAVLGLVWYDPYDLVERQHAVAAEVVGSGPARRAWLLHQLNGWTILGVVGVPAVAMGASFPLGNALAQDAAERVGRRAGSLYLATTAGNVGGALVTGFWWLPGPGIQTTALLLCGVALLAPLVAGGMRRWEIAPGLLAAGGLALLPAQTLLWATFPAGRARSEGVLEVREGLEQILVVTGRPEGPARLWTSGHPMTSTSPHAQRYMRAMAHVPLLLQDDPRRVLVICVGAGNTVHAAALHPVDEVEAVDLSRDVLAVSRWFAHSHHDVLDDPRVAAFVNDGRHHLRLRPREHYDLITLEPPPLAVAGVSSLYAREFYEAARSRLTAQGMVAQWLPAYQVPQGAVRSLVRSFVDVFPDAVLLVGSGRELLLLGGAAAPTLDRAAVERRLTERPAVADDLERLGLGSVRELATMFAADGATLREATRRAAPVTDDRPILEHAQASHLMATRLPDDLFAPLRWPTFCPDCREMGPVMQVTERLYATDAFLDYSSVRSDATGWVMAPDVSDATLAAIASSTTLQRGVFAADALALRAQELWVAGERPAARRHLQAARVQAPGLTLLDEMEEAWDADAAQTP